MHSMFLVLMLTFAVATQGFDLTEKEANRTSTESRPLPTTITDKQINNAHFSRRVFRDFDRENPVDRKARHTMIVDSGITHSDFNFRGINKRSASEPSVERKARHTMIVDTQIMDSRFHVRSIGKRGDSNMSRIRRGVSFIDTKGSGNRIVEHPARSYNEFIVEGDSDSAPALFIHNGQSVNVMRIVPSSNGAANTPNVQAMPMNGNGVNRPSSQSFSSPSASRPQAPFTGSVHGGVINGATFTRRSVDGQDKADMPLERQSRNTYIDKSQINDGRFSRRSANGLGGEDMALERQSRDTYIGKSQINDGRFSRRNTAELASEEKVST